jgi:hypothetical protein
MGRTGRQKKKKYYRREKKKKKKKVFPKVPSHRYSSRPIPSVTSGRSQGGFLIEAVIKMTLPQRPGTGILSTSQTHWAIGAVAFPFIYLTTNIMGEILGWLWKPLGKRTKVPTWMISLFMVAVFIDDVGTGVGLQAEESPRTSYEANVALVNWSHKAQEFGLFRNHTDALRYSFTMSTIVAWLVWRGTLPMTNYAKWGLFFLLPFIKMYAGHGWWSLEPRNFSVLDFFTFTKGRDCWERSNLAAGTAFNAGKTKEWYAATEDARRPAEHTMDARRRLVQGSKTFRMMEGLGWLSRWIPVIS